MDKKFLLSSIIVMATLASIRLFACTGALALGLPSAEGNLILGNFDSEVPVNINYMTMHLVIPEDKNAFRYLKMNQGNSNFMGGGHLNEKGVGFKSYQRDSKNLIKLEKDQIPTTDDVFLTCVSAKQLLDRVSKVYSKIGTTLAVGGNAVLMVDPKEGYMLEGANYISKTEHNHASYGPMKDVVFVHANFYLDRTLREHQLGSGAGYSRAKALWQHLIENQYNDFNLNPPAGSGLVLPYIMDVLKYHDKNNSMLNNERHAMYTVNNNTSINCQGNYVQTYHGLIINPSAKNTKYLSTFWATFGQPDIAPFLPFFIGVNEIPKEYSTTVASGKYFELRTLLLYNPEYREKIVHYWKVFEVETVEKYRAVRNEVTTMLKDKNDKETDIAVRKKLTDFVNERCAKAMKYLDKTINRLKRLNS